MYRITHGPGVYVESRSKDNSLIGISRFEINEDGLFLDFGSIAEPKLATVCTDFGLLTAKCENEQEEIELGISAIRPESHKLNTFYKRARIYAEHGIPAYPILTMLHGRLSMSRTSFRNEQIQERKPNLLESFILFRLSDVLFYDGYRISIPYFDIATQGDVEGVRDTLKMLPVSCIEEASKLVDRLDKNTKQIREYIKANFNL